MPKLKKNYNDRINNRMRQRESTRLRGTHFFKWHYRLFQMWNKGVSIQNAKSVFARMIMLWAIVPMIGGLGSLPREMRWAIRKEGTPPNTEKLISLQE